MATKLFLRNTAANGIGTYYDMGTTAGAASDTGVVDTVASGTEIQWTRTAGGTVLEWISGRSPAGGWTLSGTMTFSIWANQSHMNANCGARARVFKRTAAGVESEIGGGPYNDGVEFGTSAAEMTWTGTPTSTAFAEDDRLIVRYYITNVGTMGGGQTCTLTYNAADAATGDSFFQINENVTFKPETLTGPVGTATETDTAIALGAARPVGMSAETDTPLALALVLARVAGTAAETDSALALGAARPAGVATEADSALALAGVQIRGVGLATESDSALALSSVQVRATGLATEADSALALAVARPVGLALETDAALQLGVARPIGLASETDTAFALTATGGTLVGPVGRADETDSALALAGMQMRPVELASETNGAFMLGSARPVGMAVETGIALALVGIEWYAEWWAPCKQRRGYGIGNRFRRSR